MNTTSQLVHLAIPETRQYTVQQLADFAHFCDRHELTFVNNTEYLSALQQFMEDDEDGDYCYNDSMDGDAGSALASAGFGTDEDYGYYGEDY